MGTLRFWTKREDVLLCHVRVTDIGIAGNNGLQYLVAVGLAEYFQRGLAVYRRVCHGKEIP